MIHEKHRHPRHVAALPFQEHGAVEVPEFARLAENRKAQWPGSTGKEKEGREEGREEGRKGGREEGREGGRKGGREEKARGEGQKGDLFLCCRDFPLTYSLIPYP